MKSPEQLSQSIDRFHRGFWDGSRIDRPPVGIIADAIFMPINYLRQEFKRLEIGPEDVTDQLCFTDYEVAASRRRVVCDDWMPFQAAWRAIPWLEAMCGCPVR